MKARTTGPDPAVVDLARRRLGRLHCELGSPPAASAQPASAPPVVKPGDDAEGREHAPRAGRHARVRPGRLRLLRGRLTDAVPPALQGRFGVTAQHVTVLALVLAAATVLSAWLLVRSAPQPAATVARASLSLPEAAPSSDVPVASPSPPPTWAASAAAGVTAAAVSAPSAPALPGASSASSASSRVVVHVIGKVRRPGVVELPLGSRVVEALDAVGGARHGVRLGHLNLARILVDGEQIAVGVRPPTLPVARPPAAAPGAVAPLPGGTLVNINTAAQAELEELPGIGPVTATSIMEWRTEHGGFSSVDELLEVSGIGDVTLGELRDLVTV